jgi:hypothetical protein
MHSAPRRTRVVRLRIMTTDRAALDRLRDRYAAENGCTLTRMGAARAILRRALASADARPLADVLGDVDPDGVCRLPTLAVRPKGGA